MMTPRGLAFCGVLLGIGAVAGSYALAFLAAGGAPAGAWLMIFGTALLLSSTLALGAYRPGANGRLVAGLVVFLLVIIIGGFGAGLLLPEEGPDGPLLLGMPRRAGVILLGIGLLPILVLPLAYAWDFVDVGLDEDALAGWRQRGAAHRGGPDGGSSH